MIQRLKYTTLEKIRTRRPVDRLDFIEERVRDRFVFDLGALDETACQAKTKTKSWLHARICRSAKAVIGIDNSRLVPVEGIVTGEKCRIVRADVFDLGEVIKQHGVPDVIVAGEFIEHLSNPFLFLQALKSETKLGGVHLLVTTPNACCWHNFFLGLASREAMHTDHLQIYSYKTLQTLFARNGFAVETMTPYKARFTETIASSSRVMAFGTRCFQALVNGLESAMPMLSAGWILETKI